MRTGQVAAEAGVNVQTMRYYERRGLLPEPQRLESGYREYGPDAVRTVRFIKRAQELGFALRDVEAALRGVGGVEWDEHGRLVGLALTLRPTAHRFTTGGRTLYGWCADDTLMFPVALGRAGSVDSTCPETGRAIHLDLSPERVERVEPAGAVVTSVRPDTPIANVRTSTCDHGHFFASAAAASTWAAEHPGGRVHSVEEAFRLDKQALERLGWAAT